MEFQIYCAMAETLFCELLFTKCWNIELKICRLHAKTSVTMPLSSIKDLAVAISTRAGPAEDDPPLYKLGSKPIQAVCKGESGALNWAFLGDVREHLASMPLPLATFFSSTLLLFHTGLFTYSGKTDLAQNTTRYNERWDFFNVRTANLFQA